MKITKAKIIFSSLNTRYNEMKINRKGRINFAALNIIGIRKIKIGVKIRIINIAVIEP